ncbi:MAG: DNA repair protein RecO [Patescibacteria group bacterium]|nr:DNA repair protein RecO [Patescibacteria group bacterium]
MVLQKAIIFNKKNFRENDRFYLVFTKDQGKLELLGRGTRKKKSKLAGLLEPISLAEINYIPGRFFNTITSVNVIKYFKKSSFDPAINIWLGPLIEILNKQIKEKEKDERIFYLLTELFKLLEGTVNKNKQKIIILASIWQIVALLGYKPELYSCRKCGQSLKPEKTGFSYKDKGLLCLACAKNKKNLVSANIIKILRLFLSHRLKKVAKLKTKKEDIIEIIKITYHYVTYIFETEFSSFKFIKSLKTYK